MATIGQVRAAEKTAEEVATERAAAEKAAAEKAAAEEAEKEAAERAAAEKEAQPKVADYFKRFKHAKEVYYQEGKLFHSASLAESYSGNRNALRFDRKNK